MTFERVVVLFLALVVSVAGVAILVAPDSLGARAGWSASPAGLTEIRAFYGGVQVGLGCFLAWCSHRRERLFAGLLLAGLAVGGIGVARAVGLAVDRAATAYHLANLAIEAATVLVVVIAIAVHRKRDDIQAGDTRARSLWYARPRTASPRRRHAATNEGASSGRAARKEARMAARIFLALSALVWLPYGVFCLMQPSYLDGAAGVVAATPTGTTELRAMYGGLQAAIGTLCGLGALQMRWRSHALVMIVFLAAGLGFARLVGVATDAGATSYTIVALVFEGLSAGLALALLRAGPVPGPSERATPGRASAA